MKKLLTIFVLAAAVSTTSYALECQDIYGSWHGPLSSLTVSYLIIYPNADQQGASIDFNDAEGYRLIYGNFAGACKKNPDGTLSMNLISDSFGVKSIIDARLVDNNSLMVNEFSYRDGFGNNGSGIGMLHKW